MKVVDKQLVQHRRFRLVVDYANGSATQLLPNIFNRLGCDVIVLNANMEESRFSRTPDELEKDIQRLATIAATLDNHMEIRIDTGRERICVVDDRRRSVDCIKILVVI